ncbi:MAG: galactokinase family protein, partial [Candidatus Brocadiaceae bacterium]
MIAEDGPSSDESTRADALRMELAAWAGLPEDDVRLVRSPYRVCPLGAHVDHQLGQVTGMALDRALLLAFCPR